MSSAAPRGTPRTAIVIGAGFGGLALAIRLQSAGVETTIVEARDKPGGRAYVWEKDGFVFDAGPTVITDPPCLQELWALTGRDIYLREGCYNCHSQMIRPLQAETLRYGHYSMAGEFVYDHPFQWGSKRTGPDLARVGGRYSDEWHRVHLVNPRDVVPESNMPAFPWLSKNLADADGVAAKMTALRKVGVPYTDQEIAEGKAMVEGKSEMDAMIAYLQGLGLALKNVR